MCLGHHLCSSEARTQDPAQPAAKTPKAQDTATFCCAHLLEGEKCHAAPTPAAQALEGKDIGDWRALAGSAPLAGTQRRMVWPSQDRLH